jgi:hypothetical protein
MNDEPEVVVLVIIIFGVVASDGGIVKMDGIVEIFEGRLVLAFTGIVGIVGKAVGFVAFGDKVEGTVEFGG